jgi:hypothetical protein
MIDRPQASFSLVTTGHVPVIPIRKSVATLPAR